MHFEMFGYWKEILCCSIILSDRTVLFVLQYEEEGGSPYPSSIDKVNIHVCVCEYILCVYICVFECLFGACFCYVSVNVYMWIHVCMCLSNHAQCCVLFSRARKPWEGWGLWRVNWKWHQGVWENYTHKTCSWRLNWKNAINASRIKRTQLQSKWLLLFAAICVFNELT